MKLIRNTFVIILCLSLTAVFAVNAKAQFYMFQNPLVDKEAPDFSLLTLSGPEKNFSRFRDGQKAIIFFWATWCPHCRNQLKAVNKSKKNFEKDGIKLVLVDLGESARTVRSYMEKNKIDMEVFLDKEQSIAEEYGIIGVPTFYFINKDGVIKAVEHEIPSDYEKILDS